MTGQTMESRDTHDDEPQPEPEAVQSQAEEADAAEPEVGGEPEVAGEPTEPVQEEPVVDGAEPEAAVVPEVAGEPTEPVQEEPVADGAEPEAAVERETAAVAEPEVMVEEPESVPDTAEPVVEAEAAAVAVDEPVVEAEVLPPSIEPARAVEAGAAVTVQVPAEVLPEPEAAEPEPVVEAEVLPPSIEPARAVAPEAAAGETVPAAVLPEPEAAPGAESEEEPTDPAAAPAAAATPEVPDQSAETNPGDDPGSRNQRRRRFLIASAVALVAAVWGGSAWATTQTTFSGASVSGVDVSGMSTEEARVVVEESFATGLTQTVTVTAIGASDELVPADAGVSIDAAASVDKLTGFTLNPIAIVQRLTGPEVEAVVDVDREALGSALYDRLTTLSTGTVDATVTLDGTTPVVTAAVSGTGLDVTASVEKLSADWPLGETTIAMVEGVAEPAITDDDAQAFVEGTLTPLLSEDLIVTAKGTSVETSALTSDVVLTPETVASMTTISPQGGDLKAALDPASLHATVVAAMGPIETPATDATWTIDGSAAGAASATPQFVPSSKGSGVDDAVLVEALLKAGTSGTGAAARTVPVPITVIEPTVTTSEEDWGIVEVIGGYSTPFTSEPGRDQNLIRGAELMNGQIVMPGETFSVSDALEPVDAENGFASAGVVTNGEHTEAIGGGLSQIGTTMFNAGFESGMDDVEHHPHSYWFSRYPAGREATIWTGNKDVKFANSTPYPALIQAWVADGEVHARLWSTHYYDVTITSSEHFNYRPVQTITRTAGAGCTPYSGGNAGFDIVVTRTRVAPDKTVPDDVLTTSYEADHNIRCVTPEPAPAPTTPTAPAPPEQGASD